MKQKWAVWHSAPSLSLPPPHPSPGASPALPVPRTKSCTSAAYHHSLPRKRSSGFDIIWLLNLKGNGQLSLVDAAGSGLWVGAWQTLCYRLWPHTAEGCLPQTSRGERPQLEGDVVAVACEGDWQLPCLSVSSCSPDSINNECIICILNAERAAGVVPQG